jgi:ribonuclease BN (tRNA processing enzyme)
MKIRVLGCYGAELVEEKPDGRKARYQTSAFLINDTTLVDAGTIGQVLGVAEQARLRQILVTHIHFDHVKGLPFLADTVFGQIQAPIQICSIPQVLEGLRNHLLNGELWPDFTQIPTIDNPIFRMTELVEEKDKGFSGLHVTPVRVNHTVPTVGFLLRDDRGTVLYSGDTYETQKIWETARKAPHLRAAIIETSFPNDFGPLAQASGHLTPELLAKEFGKIGRPDIPVYVYHMKPQYLEQLRTEIRRLNIPNIQMLQDGQQLEV